MTLKIISKRIIYIIIAIVLCALSLLLSLFLYNGRQERKTSDMVIEKQSELLSFIHKNVYLQFLSQGRKFDAKQEFFNSDNVVVDLNDLLLPQQPVVILYTGETYCSECVKGIVTEFVAATKCIDRKKIVILFDNCSVRELYGIEINDKMGGALMLCSRNIDLPTELKQIGTPFVFVADSSSQIQDLFMPLKYFTQYNEEYYRAIVQKYY